MESDVSEEIEQVTVTLLTSTVRAALNCLEACKTDPAEPERYRRWYAEAYEELSFRAMQSGSQETPDA